MKITNQEQLLSYLQNNGRPTQSANDVSEQELVEIYICEHCDSMSVEYGKYCPECRCPHGFKSFYAHYKHDYFVNDNGQWQRI